MSNDVIATVAGRQVSHRRPGPFKVEPIAYGMAIVTNAEGINWLSGYGGGTRFEDIAQAATVADALNEAAA